MSVKCLNFVFIFTYLDNFGDYFWDNFGDNFGDIFGWKICQIRHWHVCLSSLSILFLYLYIWTILRTILDTAFGTILGKKSVKLGIGTCACRTSRFSFCLHLAGSRAVSRRLVLMLSQFPANFGITVVFRAYIQSLEKLYLTFDTFQSTPLTRKWPMLF